MEVFLLFQVRFELYKSDNTSWETETLKDFLKKTSSCL